MNLFNETPNKKSLRPKWRSHPTIQLDISFRDLNACFRSFFRTIDKQQCLNDIKSFWHTDKEILVTLSVRTSLDLLLQSLNLPPESEVLMSAVNIREMAEIIRSHGLIPVPIDISIDTVAPNLEILEQLVSPQSKVLLIAHLFGVIVPLQPYVDFCKKHNILLVEDCAQAFAGKEYFGYPQADVSLFSFGAIKSCTALGGGVALIKDKHLAQKMVAIEQAYPQKSEFWYLKRLFKFYCLKLLSLPSLYYQIINLMRLLNLDVESTIKKATLGFPTGDLLAKIRYRTPKHLLWFLNYRLSHCDDFQKRIQRGKDFFKILPDNLTIPGKKAEYNSFWVMPILINSPDAMATKLRAEGFDSARGNRSLFAIDAKPNTPNHLLPIQSQYSMAHILCVPFSRLLTPQESEYLAQLITVNVECEADETKNIVVSGG